MKHTPPPYYLDDGAIYDSCGAKIADVYYNHLGSGVPNAEFIVCVCNAHEDLIEVLRLITECDVYRGIKTGEMRVLHTRNDVRDWALAYVKGLATSRKTCRAKLTVTWQLAKFPRGQHARSSPRRRSRRPSRIFGGFH